MTLDEVLVLFNDEVNRAERRLTDRQRERQELRLKFFGNEFLLDREIQGINWLILMDTELLKALKKSRDVLLHEMIDKYL